MSLEELANTGAAVASLVAALLWFIASQVKYPRAHDICGRITGGLSRVDQHRLIDALNRNGKINSWAAFASSVAAVLAANALLLRSI